jgi:hypothetical protein
MRAVITLTLIGAAILTTTISTGAQQPPAAPGPDTARQAELESRAREKLFDRLFQTDSRNPRRNPAPRPFVFQPSLPAPADRGAEAPRVVCGMTVAPVDPKLDAGIRNTPPQDRTYTMRVQPPPPCETTR